MRRAKQILLLAAVFMAGVQGAHAALWNRHKSDAAPAAATAKTAESAMTLTAVDADAGQVTLRTSGAPAYTSYSPDPVVFVVDLSGTSKGNAITIPSTLPAGVVSISATEATEMGMRLTRVTFHLERPLKLQASSLGEGVVVTVPGALEAAAASRAAAPASVIATAAPATASPSAVPAKSEPAPAAAAPPAVTPADVPAVTTAEVIEAPAPEVAVAPAPARAMASSASPAPHASGQRASVLRHVSTSGAFGDFQLHLEGNGTIAYKSFRLQNPPRLVLDLTGIRNEAGKGMVIDDPVVKRIRISQFKGGADPVTRVVLDLAGRTEFNAVADGDELRVAFGGNSPGIHPATAVAEASRPAVSKPASQPAAVPATVVPKPAETTTVVADESGWKVPPSEPRGETAKSVITTATDQAPPNTTRSQMTTSAVGATSAARSAAAASNDNVFNEADAPQPVAGVRAPQLLSGSTSQTGGRTLSGGQRVYSGEPISLNLNGADIHDVLRTFADLTGLNIAVDPGVTGNVTVNFTDVPWDQALDIILTQNNLTWELNGNVMRIGTIDRLTSEREATRRLAEQQALNVPLDTVIFKLSYARANEVSGLLKDIASTRAKIIVDARTNQLIVSDVPTYVRTIASLIETIDVPTRQVMIEARIVEATKVFQQQYGFVWGFNGALDPSIGTGTGLVFPNRVTYTGGPFDFGPGNAVLQTHFFDVLGAFNLDLALNAFEFEGLVKVISAPKVTTQDNVPAEIQSGFQIPYQTRINFTTTITYVDATLRLSVTPQITEAGTVIMDIQVQKNEPTTGVAVEGGSGTPLSTRSARTRLMVRDGGTAVIGGIYQVKDNNSQTRMPFVHNIPVLGNLFKTHDISTSHDELLIFITPRIIRGI